MRVPQILALVVFTALIALAVVSGFASRALIDQASVTASSAAQTAITGAYSAVAVHQPNLIELGILAAVGLLASRLRWKASDRS